MLVITFANVLLLLGMNLLNSVLCIRGKQLEWCGFCIIFPAFYLPIGWGLTSVGLLGLLLDVFKDDAYGISAILLMINLLMLFSVRYNFYDKSDAQCLFLGFLFNGLWIMQRDVVQMLLAGKWGPWGYFLTNAAFSQCAMLLIGWAFFKLQRYYLRLILGTYWDR